MNSRPILMKGPLVLRSMDGRKTMTRRVFTPPACRWAIEDGWPVQEDIYGDWHQIPCPYGVPGDRLWVREKWQHELTGGFWMAADLTLWSGGQQQDPTRKHPPHKWRPGIFMPREACRLELEITAVRFERLSSITEADIYREGVADLTVEDALLFTGVFKVARSLVLPTPIGTESRRIKSEMALRWPALPVREKWTIVWDLINGHRPVRSVAEDPWVWVIEYRRV